MSCQRAAEAKQHPKTSSRFIVVAINSAILLPCVRISLENGGSKKSAITACFVLKRVPVYSCTQSQSDRMGRLAEWLAVGAGDSPLGDGIWKAVVVDCVRQCDSVHGAVRT